MFAALRAAFRAAQRHGPAVLTATLAAGMPTDELVGDIQSDVDQARRGGTRGSPGTGGPLAGRAASRSGAVR